MALPVVSVVIPNWNGLEFLKVVLPSLKQQTFTDFEIIVVDDASSDDSVAYVRKTHPEVTMRELPKNLGFAGACNEGFEAAKGTYVMLLNNDIELDRKCLAELVKAAELYPKAGSLTCKMLSFDQRTVIDEVGGQASWHGVFTPRGRGETDRGQYNELTPVLYGSGGATLYRKAALDEVGLLDCDFFAYLEDVDWGFRAQLAGWGCFYVPTAMVYHMGGASFKRISGLAQRMWARNTRFVIFKDYPFAAWLKYFPKIMFGEAKTFLGAVKDGWFWTYLRSWFGFWWKFPKLVVKRSRIQRRRTVDLRYLDSLVSSEFPAPSRVLGKEAK